MRKRKKISVESFSESLFKGKFKRSVKKENEIRLNFLVLCVNSKTRKGRNLDFTVKLGVKFEILKVMSCKSFMFVE